MLRLKKGDLVAVKSQTEEKFYYALVLDKIALFGGNWTYVFHRTSSPVVSSVVIPPSSRRPPIEAIILEGFTVVGVNR